MKIGILGGTFDPVHWGHIGIAQDSHKQFGLGRILFAPALIPPHKQGRDISPTRHRLAMLKLALEPYAEFEITDVELNRPGNSYTIDTINTLHPIHPNDSLFLIIGADNMPDFKNWHRVHELVGLCEFIIVSRPGYEIDLEKVLEPDFSKDEIQHILMHMMLNTNYNIAANAIRTMAAAGKSISHLVPPPVAEYIVNNNLYK